MVEHYDPDLDPVSFITVGTVGPPGERTFYLQGAHERRIVTLIIEKEHAAALSFSIQRLLQSVDDPDSSDDEPAGTPRGMDLLQPIEPVFRVGQLGIGIDEERRVIVLVAEELSDDDEEGDDEGRKARFVASFAQMRLLSQHAMDVVGQGRPVCELCGEPIEDGEHFCPRRNGHPPPLI